MRIWLHSLREIAFVLLGPPPWWIHSFWRRDGVPFAVSSCSCSLGRALLWAHGSFLTSWPPNGRLPFSSVVVALQAQLAEEFHHRVIDPNLIAGFSWHFWCSIGTTSVSCRAISNENYKNSTSHHQNARTQPCHSLLIDLVMRRGHLRSQFIGHRHHNCSTDLSVSFEEKCVSSSPSSAIWCRSFILLCC